MHFFEFHFYLRGNSMIATSFKAKAIALAFGLSMFSAVSAFAADKTLVISNGEAYFGNDFGAGGIYTDTFKFSLTGLTDVSGTASSYYTTIGDIITKGFDITSVTLASVPGQEYTQIDDFIIVKNTLDTWTFSAPTLAPGDYYLTITGVAGTNTNSVFKASYGGSLSFVASVPEPETYGMLALGLGLIGFAARRRQNNVKFF